MVEVQSLLCPMTLSNRLPSEFYKMKINDGCVSLFFYKCIEYGSMIEATIEIEKSKR